MAVRLLVLDFSTRCMVPHSKHKNLGSCMCELRSIKSQCEVLLLRWGIYLGSFIQDTTELVEYSMEHWRGKLHGHGFSAFFITDPWCPSFWCFSTPYCTYHEHTPLCSNAVIPRRAHVVSCLKHSSTVYLPLSLTRRPAEEIYFQVVGPQG